MKNELKVFMSGDFGEVRTVEEDGKILFCGSDVAKSLGYAKPNNAIKTHCKGATLKQGIVDSIGRNQDMLFISEGDLYRLTANSKLKEAERFESWVFDEVIPSIRKTGTYTADNTIKFKEQVECIGIVSDILRVNETSKILMLKDLYNDHNLPCGFLPDYGFNGNKEMKSATELLKRFSLDMSARSFNVLLRAQGYLEEKTRSSRQSKSGQRKYNCLTEKGLRYGENAINPQCQKETQPLYYVDTFQELFNKAIGRKAS